MEATVAVLIEVSLSRSVKPTNGHIHGNAPNFNCQEHISNGGSSLPSSSIHDFERAILNASDSTGREGFLPFTFSSTGLGLSTKWPTLPFQHLPLSATSHQVCEVECVG